MVAMYVTKSPKRGTYSYRRKIPTSLQKLWGKLEIKQSLKTKDYSVALARAAKVNQNFEQKSKHLQSKLNDNASSPTPDQIWFTLEEASALLKKHGLHPDQAPIPGIASKQEIEDWELGVETFRDAYIDNREIGVNPETWDRIYRPESPTDPMDQAMAILQGRAKRSIEPSIHDALEMYLSTNQQAKNRSPYNQKKFEQANRRAADRLSSYVGGKATKLTDISRIQIRNFVEHLKTSNPSWKEATVNKDIQRLHAIWNTGIKEFELSIANHFSGLQSKTVTTGKKKLIRSFKPDELAAYKEALSTKTADVQLIGMLMMATGARMNEIAGLRMGEVSLGSNIPHIKLRFNSVRRLKNEPSIRDVPLVGEALDLLRDFVATHEDAKPDDPLFARYGRDGGRDAISQVLNKIVDSSVSDDPKLIPNSTRHTMTDRLDAVRCPESIKAAILGWSSGQSIRMADNYGTGDPFWSIQKELERAVAVEDWGQFND